MRTALVTALTLCVMRTAPAELPPLVIGTAVARIGVPSVWLLRVCW